MLGNPQVPSMRWLRMIVPQFSGWSSTSAAHCLQEITATIQKRARNNNSHPKKPITKKPIQQHNTLIESINP